jgi:alkanesulfonate monooxygenase SsuD/methylene tetrahydromethanopterin reductase-like flavin-dependent oxidoreductase (luciferase family)
VSGRSQRERWGLRGLALGISLGGAARPDDWPRLLAWVERAEALGLHSVWLPEMHFARGASASPLVALAAFAARSRRLRLGTTSLLLSIHDPARVAREARALDRLSGGRVVLGLGRGFRAPLFAGFGVDAASKRDRFDAALDRILALWREEPPEQRPHPPLAVAAFGPKGLRQAARRGLPYLASPVEPFQQLLDNQRRHREQLPPASDPADLVVPVMRTVHVAADDGEAARVREGLEAEWRTLGGRVPEAVARAARADVEERAIVGTAERVVDRLGRYREALGLDLLIARVQVGGASEGERAASLERLAGEVLPALRS